MPGTRTKSAPAKSNRRTPTKPKPVEKPAEEAPRSEHLVEEPGRLKLPDIPEGVEGFGRLCYLLADAMQHVTRIRESEMAGADGYGPRYSYASVFDMLDQVRPLLAKRGLVLIGSTVYRDMVRSTFERDGGKLGVEVILPVEWLLADSYGDTHKFTTVGEARDTSDKATNKAHTAAEKLAMRALVHLSTGEPDDPERDNLEESSGGWGERPTQRQPSRQPRQSGGKKIDPQFGECPEHPGHGFYLTEKAKAAGHGASHVIEGGGFCEYEELRTRLQERLGNMIRDKFESKETWAEYARANKVVEHPPLKFTLFRPEDWLAIDTAIRSLPDVQPELASEQAPEPESKPAPKSESGNDKPSKPASKKKPAEYTGECGDDAEVDGVPSPCRLPAGHPDEIAHNGEPSLEELAEAQKAIKS